MESETDEIDPDKNAEVFALMTQMLDDRSLTLIIRDARNNGRLAMKILREHYVGSSKPRIISLYTELTSLKMSEHENVTDYMLRGENAVLHSA